MTDDMAADKRTNSTHVRLSDEADAVLELMSQAQGREKAAVLAELGGPITVPVFLRNRGMAA